MCGSLPKKFFTVSITFGIRVIPPTRITSLISLALVPESFSAVSQGASVLSMSFSTRDSSFALVIFTLRCFGPVLSAVRNGRLISVCAVEESSHLAFSAPSLILCMAKLSLLMSIPVSFLNSLIRYSTMALSKSSPPSDVSPFVDFTSNTPSPISSIDTSNVPPPRSYTAIVPDFFLSNPYASAAAVGSLTIRSTSSPAILPASLVACLCASLKYAGTVITAFVTA